MIITVFPFRLKAKSKYTWRNCISGSLIALLCSQLLCSGVMAQPYRPITCKGDIPQEFRTVTATKVLQAQAEILKSDRDSKEKRSINDFLLKNNYVIDALLTSGKVLYGDSITTYIESVADKILKDNPDLRSSVRFYTVKSSEVNAFTTNQGIIFVTIGLLAQIENEAQLAFVLSHELAHYEKKHSIAQVLENERVYDETRNERYSGNDKRIRLLSSFSKDMEYEADSIGYVRFINAGYKKKEASRMMDVLQWSFLPLDDIPFDLNFLQFDSLKFPVTLQLDSLTPIPLFDDNEDDSKSSHPNIFKRRLAIDRLINSSPDRGTASNENSLSGNFLQIQALARKEFIHELLIDKEYLSAFYNAYVMLSKKGEDQYLEESIGKALYGISKYKNGGILFRENSAWTETYSHFQNFSFLFENLEKNQINLLAIRYLFQIHNKYKNPFIGRLLDDVITEGIKSNSLKSKGFSEEVYYWRQRTAGLLTKNEPARSEPENEQNEIQPEVDTTESSSKFAKLRKNKVEAENNLTTAGGNDELNEQYSRKFIYRAFELTEIYPLITKIDSLEKRYREKEKDDEEWQEHLEEKKKFYKRKGYALGIDSLVIVDPFFIELNERKGLELKGSETQLIEFKDQIELCTKEAGINSQVLFPKEMNSEEVNNYNTMALMNDWVTEYLEHDENNIVMIPLQSEYTARLAQENGTPYFCYTGVTTITNKRDNFSVDSPCAYIVLFPYYLYRAFSPAVDTKFYFMMFDIVDGDSVWLVERKIRRKAEKGNVNSLLYDTLYQIKNDR